MGYNKKKYIFLDIDGVVNTFMIYNYPIGDKRGLIERDGFYYDICNPSDKRVSNIMAVTMLNKLCKQTGADIVISSTWRRGHYEDTIEALYNSGLDRSVKIIGKTPIMDGYQRGVEIERWFKDNNIDYKDVNFCILDDDSDMEGLKRNFKKNWVRCRCHVGFLFEEYDEAYGMLIEGKERRLKPYENLFYFFRRAWRISGTHR